MPYVYNPLLGAGLDQTGGSGGGGTPGGSDTQVQFNNAGAFGGISTFTFSSSILTTSGRFINSYNATASSPAKAFTGTWFTGGTGTTTKPQVLIEPTGATSTAWSTSGTGLGVNAASGFGGNLLDLQVNGSSRFRVTSNSINLSDAGYGFQIAQSGGNQYLGPTTGQALFITTGGTTRLTLNGDGSAITATSGTPLVANHRLTGTAPATASDTGTAGDVRYDASYVYICTATNTWKRAAITTW
jgi:hypothetical protein